MPTIAHHAGGGHASAFALSYGGQAALPTGLLLLDRAGKGATKALRFAPRLTNLVPQNERAWLLRG